MLPHLRHVLGLSIEWMAQEGIWVTANSTSAIPLTDNSGVQVWTVDGHSELFKDYHVSCIILTQPKAWL